MSSIATLTSTEPAHSVSSSGIYTYILYHKKKKKNIWQPVCLKLSQVFWFLINTHTYTHTHIYRYRFNYKTLLMKEN